jgi:hypothetical protein
VKLSLLASLVVAGAVPCLGLGSLHAEPSKTVRALAAPAPAPDGTGARAQRPGVADTRRIVGILDVRVTGVADDVRDQFQRALADQFDTRQFWLASPKFMRDRLSRSTTWTEGCVVGGCLAEVRAQTGAELVLLAALEGAGGTSFGYVITLVRTDNGRVLAQNAERCDVCRISEVIDKATLATVELLNNVPDKLPDEAAEQAAALDAVVGRARREVAAGEAHSRRLGIVLTALGLAAAATGAALYEAEHKPDYASLTAVGGAGLALGGVAILSF